MSDIPSTSFPPIAAISKHKWPTFSGTSDTFLEWKAQFLAVLCSTELAPLYDASVDNLIMPSTRADVIPYDIQLYSRIIAALPASNSFIGSAEYRSKGLALWHALGQEHESTGSYSRLDNLLSTFYSPSLSRSDSETNDTYWNRYFSLVRKITSDPNAPPFSRDYIRKKFITTLGTGFEYIRKDANNERLALTLLICSDEELKSILRKVNMNKSSNSAVNISTVSAYGYGTHHANAVNAVKPPTSALTSDRTPVDPRIDTLCTLAANTAKLLAEHSTILNKCVAALNKPTRSLQYCWTHGGCNHKSADCRTKAVGHQDTATLKDRKGGSERNLKRE